MCYHEISTFVRYRWDMDKIFFHIDVNSAFLSWTAVDRLRNGDTLDLRTVPSIIGGDREKRHGIVLAKSIPAKAYGIVTAEPVASALRKCPGLIVMPGDFKLYSEMSRKMFDYLYSLTPDIEPASIDEGYLLYSPIAHLYGEPEKAAAMIRNTIRDNFGFTVNVGISDRKVLAKMASDFSKPDKTHTLYSREIQSKMWPLPVGYLFLCVKSATVALQKLNIRTIGDLANTDPAILSSHLKSHGITLWNFANGIDPSDIVTEFPDAKGIGNSTTSEHDITDREEAYAVLYSLCESVSGRLHRAGFKAMLVTVEIKYATFKSYSKQHGVPTPIETAKALHQAATELFDELWTGDPIRLLGVRATKLVAPGDPVQLSIFDYDPERPVTLQNTGNAPAAMADEQKALKLENALRDIRGRFGKDSVKKGFSPKG